MNIKQYKGHVVSVMIRNVSRPVGGYLEEVTDEFITIAPTTPQMEKIFVSTKDVVSVIINRVNGVNNNERQRREQNPVHNNT